VRESRRLRSFPQLRNGGGLLSTGTRNARGRPGGEARRSVAEAAKRSARAGLVGYPSRVCSTTGDAIDRIVAAIDQLASDALAARDAQGAAGEPELSRRVAGLWQMVSDLDPELARRAKRYTTPDGGAPSA
jgi:hypothetical protein